MIFLHRQNNIKAFTEAIEVDVRSSPRGLVLNHDRLDFSSEYPLIEALKGLTKTAILNIKESGVEEELIHFCLTNNIDFYFLDSQIPDILRLSKEYPQHSYRFIIRVSDVESISQKLMALVKPKYIWVDYSEFDSFNIENYINFLKSIKTESEMILVSPELYSLKYLDITKEIISRLKFEQLNSFNICTKHPELYKELGCSI